MMNVKAVMGSTFVIVRNYQYEGDFVIGHWIPEKRWFKLSDGDCYTADELLSDEFDTEFYTDFEIEKILKEAMDKRKEYKVKPCSE